LNADDTLALAHSEAASPGSAKSKYIGSKNNIFLSFLPDKKPTALEALIESSPSKGNFERPT